MVGGDINWHRNGVIYRMNDQFYELYKSLRDMVADFHDKDLNQPFIDFIESTKANCDRHDRSNAQYLERWQNERFLLFRFHRGGLDESLQTVTIIESFDHLWAHIKLNWDVEPILLRIEPYIYDYRIDWNTHLVSVIIRVNEVDAAYPVGYLNKKPFWELPSE